MTAFRLKTGNYMKNAGAFFGDAALKAEYITQLQAHYEADEIIKGKYWENGKGCAVGCTIHSGDHFQYLSILNIPESLALLEDCIFEGMPNVEAKEFPLQFLSAIKPGANLSKVTDKFIYWCLGGDQTEPTPFNRPDQLAITANVRELYRRKIDGEIIQKESWDAAMNAARDAIDTIDAMVARAAMATRAARDAKDAMAVTAAMIAMAAAAATAARDARDATAAMIVMAATAATAARDAAYSLMAKKIITLLQEC